MKYCLTFFLALLLGVYAKTQTITVSGQCITGSITLTANGTYNGKTLYQGTGSAGGYNNVAVNLYWLGTPDNLWVLDFDGQPYYKNPCNSITPYGTGSPGCPWTTVEGTSCTGPNALVISGGVLAVRLSSFTAQKQNKEVLLNWATASEINNKGFEVQRSIDGIKWNSLGFIAGAGNATIENRYNYIDHAPVNGLNYYRISMQEYNGTRSHSPILNIDMSGAGFYSIANNLVNGNIQLAIYTQEPVSAALFDLSGRRLFDLKVANGMQQIDMTALATGTYLLKLIKGNETITEKIIKL